MTKARNRGKLQGQRVLKIAGITPQKKKGLEMERSARYLKGLETMLRIGSRTDNLGKRWEEFGEIGEDISRYLVEFAFGDIWSRPVLDLKTRRIMVIAMLTAMGRERQLRSHIAGALAQGLSQEEILETLVHTIPYAGFPAALTGLEIAREVFKEQGTP